MQKDQRQENEKRKELNRLRIAEAEYRKHMESDLMHSTKRRVFEKHQRINDQVSSLAAAKSDRINFYRQGNEWRISQLRDRQLTPGSPQRKSPAKANTIEPAAK